MEPRPSTLIDLVMQVFDANPLNLLAPDEVTIRLQETGHDVTQDTVRFAIQYAVRLGKVERVRRGRFRRMLRSDVVASDCMICDLYAVIDRHLTDDSDGCGEAIADIVADIVTVLPPRGHGLHNLAILERFYTTTLPV